MEARVMLAYLFRHYTVTLAEPTKTAALRAREPDSFIGENRGTMGPKDGLHVTLTRRLLAD
jgi:hypothetical protein